MGEGERVLCAVSGGADSLALCDAMDLLREEMGFALAVGHVDHGLRPDSAADADRVASFARSRGLPCFVVRVHVARRASLEEAAREARLAALREMAAGWGATRIALGHTATDRAETLLLFLARGAGRKGLASMEPLAAGGIVRPLCEVTREEARAYARARALPFADDPMNEEPAFARNRVRSEVLPALRRLNPRADLALAAAAQDLALEEAWLSAEAAARRADLFHGDGAVRFARADAIRDLPAALRARVLLGALAEVRGSPRRLGRRHLALLEALLRPGAREVNLPGATGWRDGAFLCLATARAGVPEGAAPLRVDGPGVVRPRDGIEFEFRRLTSRGSQERPGPDQALFDAGTVGFPLWIRAVRPGDRMRIEGGGRKKVADELGAAGVPATLRRGWLLLCDADEVLWVPGLRRSARGRPKRSGEVLSVRVRGLMFLNPYANQVERRGVF